MASAPWPLAACFSELLGCQYQWQDQWLAGYTKSASWHTTIVSCNSSCQLSNVTGVLLDSSIRLKLWCANGCHHAATNAAQKSVTLAALLLLLLIMPQVLMDKILEYLANRTNSEQPFFLYYGVRLIHV